MQVIPSSEMPRIRRGSETRAYYNVDYARLVVTRIPPGHVQNRHSHHRLVEVTLVLQGEIEVSEETDAGTERRVLAAGDLVCFPAGLAHNVANPSDRWARTLTLKIAKPLDLSLEQFSELAEGDWTGHP